MWPCVPSLLIICQWSLDSMSNRIVNVQLPHVYDPVWDWELRNAQVGVGVTVLLYFDTRSWGGVIWIIISALNMLVSPLPPFLQFVRGACHWTWDRTDKIRTFFFKYSSCQGKGAKYTELTLTFTDPFYPAVLEKLEVQLKDISWKHRQTMAHWRVIVGQSFRLITTLLIHSIKIFIVAKYLWL